MPPRLSELLERIRPAGAPGASTEGERVALRVRREDEVASIVAILTEFEADADATIAAARRDAEHIVSDGQRRAREILARTGDRVATVRADTERRYVDTDNSDEIIRASSERIAALRARADDEIPGLVAQVVTSIWTAFIPPVAPKARR